jgi:squalene-hopene/tetraprenyl-beta-curcumene cyclase
MKAKNEFTSDNLVLNNAWPPSGSQVSLKEVDGAIRRTRRYYLGQQYQAGYWWYELESNVTITAEYLMLFRFLGIKDVEKERKIVNYILDHQREDGTWAIYFNGPGDVSTSVEAYLALKMAGEPPEAPHMKKAAEAIGDMGGIESTRLFTKIFLAVFGQYSWKRIPTLPVEMILLPGWSPFSVYDFSSWARATLIPLSVLLHYRPVFHLPASETLEELPLGLDVRYGPMQPFSARWAFHLLDGCLKRLQNHPFDHLRQKALGVTEKWILDHQEPTGDWGGIQPAMANSILALKCLGHGLDHPAIAKGLEALENFCLEDDRQIHLQSCISPVWDTALTAMALLDSGLSRDHPALEKSGRWLLSQQIFAPGDWSVKNPHLEPGGWAFEFKNDWYPDVDDSAVVLMVLRRLEMDGSVETWRRIQQGIQWVLGMRSRNGGWGSFDINNDKEILNKIPFADLEANLDPPTADLTGRVLEMMGVWGFHRDHPLAVQAIRFIKDTQEPDGCWWGRWGVNYIYGTWSVVCGLASIGEDLSLPYVRRAVRWLQDHQNWDGGWGETCDSYRRPELRGSGPSTASQTAWALMALLAASESQSPAVARGINYLLAHQREDGTWEEEYFTGTGFPKYFMLKYHNYRICFPLMALGRYRAAMEKTPSGQYKPCA